VIVLAVMLATFALPVVLFVLSFRAGYANRFLDRRSVAYCLKLPLILLIAKLLVWLAGKDDWIEFETGAWVAVGLAVYLFAAYAAGVFFCPPPGNQDKRNLTQRLRTLAATPS